MHAIITGATGLLGRHLVAQLTRHGWTITAVVRETSDRTGLELTDVRFHICDLARELLPPTLFRNADVVFHAAAAVTDWAPWPYFYANTVLATQRLCDAMASAGCRRLLHISTVGVYGRPRTSDWLREDSPHRSIGRWDYYTNSKIQAERTVWQYHRQRRLDVTVLRPGIMYGPGDRALVARVIELLRDGKILLAGDPQTCLPLVHVEDVARAAVLAATNPQAIGQAFNVVSPEQITQAEFFNTIAALVGAPPVRHRVPYRLAYAAGFAAELLAHALRRNRAPAWTRYRVSLFGHRRCYATDRIRDILGWHPEISFQQGIQQAVRWHLQKVPTQPPVHASDRCCQP